MYPKVGNKITGSTFWVGGKAALGFGADWIKTGYHCNRKLPLTYNRKTLSL